MTTTAWIVTGLLFALWVVTLALLQRERRSRAADLDASDRRLREAQQSLDRQHTFAQGIRSSLKEFSDHGVFATGRVPDQEFAETLVSTARTLSGSAQALLCRRRGDTMEWLPVASQGFALEALRKLHVRPGAGALGHVIESRKTTTLGATTLAADGVEMQTPALAMPIELHGQATGLLVVAGPGHGGYNPDAQRLMELLAAQSAVIFFNHQLGFERQRMQEEVAATLARAVLAKDSYTHDHSDRTRALVRATALEVHLPEPLILQLEFGGLLHDVGKIGIDDVILRKPGKLTPEEYDVMKRHPQIGYRILYPLPFMRAVASIVLYHQEWYNGNGYPDGLAGEEIPLGARLISILDAWDAMTSDRPYRTAISKAAASTELRRQAGTQFDPKLVDAFLRVIDRLEREGVATTEVHASHA